MSIGKNLMNLNVSARADAECIVCVAAPALTSQSTGYMD